MLAKVSDNAKRHSPALPPHTKASGALSDLLSQQNSDLKGNTSTRRLPTWRNESAMAVAETDAMGGTYTRPFGSLKRGTRQRREGSPDDWRSASSADCERQRCWSTTHALEDREAAYERYGNGAPPSKCDWQGQLLVEYEGCNDGLEVTTPSEDTEIAQCHQTCEDAEEAGQYSDS